MGTNHPVGTRCHIVSNDWAGKGRGQGGEAWRGGRAKGATRRLAHAAAPGGGRHFLAASVDLRGGNGRGLLIVRRAW